MNKGFTLVELAIVMIIIGLLIGGILKGTEMIENAKISATMSQLKAYQAALLTYRDTYSGAPGDMRNATSRIPGCTAATLCLDGDGNSIIGAVFTNSGWNQDQSGAGFPNEETTQFWKHLVLADLITGITTDANPANPAWGETHPAGKVGGGWHVFTDTGSASGISLRLQNPVTGTPVNTSTGGLNVLSPLRAYQLDRKMDDGSANSGSMWSMPRNGLCANGGDYLSQERQKNCASHFQIDGGG